MNIQQVFFTTFARYLFFFSPPYGISPFDCCLQSSREKLDNSAFQEIENYLVLDNVPYLIHRVAAIEAVHHECSTITTTERTCPNHSSLPRIE